MANIIEYITTISDEDPKLLHYIDGELQTEDGHAFPIHKIALAKNSKYFFTLFCGPGKGRTQYLIPGITGEVLGNILLYVYTGKINVTEENICDIIIASDYLLVDPVLSRMKTLLDKNLSVNNCLDINQWLMKMNRMEFLKLNYRFIETHFEEIVCNTDINFSEWPLEFLKQVLNDRNLRVQNETIVWQVIVRWVEADFLNRQPRVPDLLLYLRISDVDEKLASEVLQHAIVAENTFCSYINFGSTNKYRDILEFHQLRVWNDTQSFPFCVPRKPFSLNFIGYYCPWSSFDGIEMYVTYDENIDLWRKILKVKELPRYFVLLGDCIYLFDPLHRGLCYNIVEKQWVELKDLKTPRTYYAVVSLGGCIYTIGGNLKIDHDDDDDYDLETDNIAAYNVEIYYPNEGSWKDIMSMLPIITHPEAVTLNGLIYVVGTNTAETGMAAQMYNPSTKSWNELPGPSVYRRHFAIVAYKEKIYIVGGWNGIHPEESVEVFDPLKNIWYSAESLPYYYTSHRALIFNDQLIVSENPYNDLYTSKVNPPVQWKNDGDCWETIEESSPLFEMYRYFFHVQDADSINVISMENKKPTTVFEKSPFF